MTKKRKTANSRRAVRVREKRGALIGASSGEDNKISRKNYAPNWPSRRENWALFIARLCDSLLQRPCARRTP
jgi:hypothetical protein